MVKVVSRVLGVAAALLVLGVVPIAQADPVPEPSAFDRNADNWILTGDAVGATGWGGDFDLSADHASREGNPGGSIYGVDAAAGIDFFFQAPPRFLGDQSALYGTALEFDVRYTGGGDALNISDVILVGGGVTLVIDSGVEPVPGVWTSYSIQLDESADWRVTNMVSGQVATPEDIRRVLRNLTSLRIRGEYAFGVETTYLDNLRIVP